MIFALALGTLVGEWIDLDDKMERLGAWLKAKADRGGDSQFVQGFVTASLTVCIGAMAVVDNLSFLGSILIFCVGANLAFDTKLRVANMLPALVFGGLWTTFI